MPPGAVHAWLVQLDDHALDCRAHVLSHAERDCARAFIRATDGRRFGAARSALRLILAGYLGADPAGLVFSRSRGRPELAGSFSGDVEFSVAHSRELALIVVSTGPAGADIEAIVARPGLPDLAAARFPAAEAARIAGGCCGQPLHAFYRHWTAKEAYLKLSGHGLSGLGQTEFECGPAPAVIFAGRPAAGLVCTDLGASPRYAATVFASQPVSSFRTLDA
jgi:4'-phosphopantetheinyl transferase